MAFTTKILNKNICHVIFDTQYEMNNTLLRVQEYYESPKFRQEVFTLGQYRADYIDRKGNFDYYETVAGMNFSIDSFEPFLKGLFDPLSAEEYDIINRIARGTTCEYVIATYLECEASTIEHEICHALYGTNDEYKEAMDAVMARYDTSKIERWLRKNEYSKDVIMDEVHAYVVCDSTYLKEDHNLKIEDSFYKELLGVRREYLPKTVY